MKKHIKFCSIIYLLCYSFAVYANPYATVTSVDGNVVLHSNNNQPIKILQELNRGDSIEVINGSLKIVFDNDNKEYILKEKGIYLIDENKSISKSGKLIIGREINKKTENIALNEIKQTEQGALQLRSSNSKKDFSILEIEAIKKSNKGILSFDTITTISKDDGIAFKVLVRKDATLSISYLHNGKKSNLLKTKSFKKGDSFIVPKEDKFIYLKKPGKHNFIFEYENNQERIFSILINENKKILKKLASVGFKKKKGVTNSINNTYK